MLAPRPPPRPVRFPEQALSGRRPPHWSPFDLRQRLTNSAPQSGDNTPARRASFGVALFGAAAMPGLPRRGFALQPRVARIAGYPGSGEENRSTLKGLRQAILQAEPFQGSWRPSMQSQGSSLREQPWAVRRNSFGVKKRPSQHEFDASHFRTKLLVNSPQTASGLKGRNFKTRKRGTESPDIPFKLDA
jgi:hypothetical protein